MKKLVALMLSLAMVLSMAACGSSAQEAPADTAPAASQDASADGAVAEGQTFTIGICNYVDDASLNQIVANIQDQLAELGASNNVTFEIKYQNCNADANILSQIVADFIGDNVDLMVGVATPVAMTMQGATEDNQIPVVFAAVSDPLGCGLVASMDAPGANITGTSDALDTTAIMNLMFAENPELKTVGLLYDAGQDSSTAAIAAAKEYLQDKGVTVVEKTGTTDDEVALAAQALIDKGCEAIFTPSDNTIMAAELGIYETLRDAGVRHYAGADSFALNGAFVGYGVDYANLGVETANMVYDILVNDKDVASYPVKTFDNGTATVNTDICAAFNIDFDELSKTFAPYCTKVEAITTAESFEDLQ